MRTILLVVGMALSAFAQAPRTVSISGVVVDAAGVPVSGTKVTYNNSPATVRDRVGHMRVVGPVIRSDITTGKDGGFSASGLPPGVYWLCAEGLASTQIRSCDWGYGGTKVDLTSETTASGIELKLHAGVVLTFHVNDARNQVRDFPSDLGSPGNFRIFVVDGALMKPARPVSAGGGLRQYAVTVPASRTLRLLLDTKLTVQNQGQGTVRAGKLDDTIAVGSGPMTYEMSVQ
jgi:hypothetical protein